MQVRPVRPCACSGDSLWESRTLTSRHPVDNLHNTAGDIALSLNNENGYSIVRDAGIRSGASFSCVSSRAWYIELPRWRWAELYCCVSELILRLLAKHTPSANSPLNLILKATDETPAGSTDAFLSTKLQYTKDEQGQDICLVKVNNEEEVGVMMGWERGISK